MANETSRVYGAFTGKARRILVTLTENAATMPDISVERANLERELTAVEEAKSRQDAFRGEKQRATQDMREALGRAREAVLQLQSAAKFKLGPHNQKLASYLVKPLGKRGSRLAAKLKRQEEALTKHQESLLAKEAELARQKEAADSLKAEVELLKREVAAKELAR
jgi:hypothetical protein